MKYQSEAIENFIAPIRENLVEARERFDVFVAQPRSREEQLRVRRRLVSGAFGLFALAGATTYAAAISSEQAYWETSVNEGVGAAGDLLAAGAFIWAGSRLVKAGAGLSPAPISSVVTPLDIPKRIPYEDNEYQTAA